MTIPPRKDFTQTFFMRSCADVLFKAECEIERFEGAQAHQDMAHHAINAAWTLWHLADWIWEWHEDAVRKRLPNIPKNDGKRHFMNWLKSESIGLAACDVIANAAKHGGVAAPKNRPNVKIVPHLINGEICDILSGRDTGEWRFDIHINNNICDVVLALKSGKKFWNDFLDSAGIYRDEQHQSP